MASRLHLSWALKPDPVVGTRIVAVWTAGNHGTAEPVDVLAIDLMGQARHFHDQVTSEWIPIPDDASDLPVDVVAQPIPIRACPAAADGARIAV